ncbi:uncharacterized protein LOC111353341 [Spodoptera litura]|uniref:Uncharacterized protein LOC111353341 n=1 Tax=Spodoptera litura TaxID=69820 RepID=A0A9J7IQB0_SPOLT|nr:uncharacterized protein LOC111353341 [Spodoptera litura]
MYKSLIILCVVYCVVIEARPKWQVLPPMPGYVPVYIRPGDTPLEEINLDLAEAFHELPSGRSVGKQVEASPEAPEQADQPQPDEVPAPADEIVDHRPYEKKILEKKKKTDSEIPKPIERR